MSSNLDTAFGRFFKKQAKYPQYKKRSQGIGSFYVETPIHVGVDWIQLPVVGKVRLFEHGYIPQDRDLDKPDRKAKKKRRKQHRADHILITYKSAVISEQGDIGLSLSWSRKPSLIPFQMQGNRLALISVSRR